MIDTPYFLDSNILISAKNDTYPFDVFPSFWKHMEEAIKSRRIFILDVVRDELLKGEDILNNWIKEIQPIVTKTSEQCIIDAYSRVSGYVYSLQQYDFAIKDSWFRAKSIADPWLIAASVAYKGKIITYETDRRPNATKRLIIPNIASFFSVECIKPVQVMRELNIVI